MKGGVFPRPFRSLSEGDPPPAVLLSGDGVGLAALVGELLLERFRREGKTTELTQWTGADLEKDAPSAEWRSPSFFARNRIFLLPDLAETKKKARDEIRAYLAAPEPSATLVIPSSDRGMARSFSAIPGVRSFAPGEEEAVQALAGYAVGFAGRAGAKLDGESAAFLARWVGGDFPRLKEETAKLVAFVGGNGSIGEAQIRELCVACGAVDPFALAEALLRRDAARCLGMFRAFARAAQESDYHGLLGAVAWKVRRAATAPGSRLSARRTGEILAALSRLDRGMKGESGLSPEQIFEMCLIRLLG